jgi:hypothetical protein
MGQRLRRANRTPLKPERGNGDASREQNKFTCYAEAKGSLTSAARSTVPVVQLVRCYLLTNKAMVRPKRTVTVSSSHAHSRPALIEKIINADLVWFPMSVKHRLPPAESVGPEGATRH